MRIFSVATLLSVCAAAVSSANPQEALPVRFEQGTQLETDQTAARILSLHSEARGGEEALEAVRSLQLTGTKKEGSREFQVTHYYAFPNKFRKEVYREELGWRYLTVYGFDGTHAWRQEVLPSKKPAVVLEEKEMSEVHGDQFRLHRIALWKSMPGVFTYQGEAKAAGAPTYLVRYQEKDAAPLYLYFDQKHFLLRSIGSREVFLEREVDLDRFPTLWQLKDGIRIEAAFELRNRGELLSKTEFTKIQVNPVLEDSLFEMPEYRELWLHQTGRGEAQLERRPGVPGEDPAPLPGR